MMKVVGSVIGLTQNQEALNPFCFSAQIFSLLIQEYLEKNNPDVYNRKHHYRLQTTASQIIHKNVN